MVRALLLLAAAVAIAFLPVNRVIQVVTIAALLAAAAAFGWFAEEQERDRETQMREAVVAERAHWQPAPPGLVRVVSWETLAPLRFANRWTVDALAHVVSPEADKLTGIEFSAEAFDCPDQETAVNACVDLGRSTASLTFLPIAAGEDRRLRLRFEFPSASYPARTLRLVPTVTAVRR
jgi:hypothetical protein